MSAPVEDEEADDEETTEEEDVEEVADKGATGTFAPLGFASATAAPAPAPAPAATIGFSATAFTSARPELAAFVASATGRASSITPIFPDASLPRPR